MNVLLLGCSGFVGRELVPYLLELGHTVTRVSRRDRPATAWSASDRLVNLRLDPADPASWQREDLRAALAAADGVVNLAGEPIAEQRWTEAHRQKLVSSRVATTEALVTAMAALETPPRVLVQASAVGYYGTSLQASFSEASPAGADFLAHICQRWEAAAAAPAGCRLVTLRIGIVLGPDGGALGKMLPVFRLGFGGPVGSGQQWMSWIHRLDLVRLIATALEDSAYAGVYNAVAPEPARMGAFASALGKALGRPSLLPVPAPILQLLLGDGAKVVLEGQRVLPDRLQQQGFAYRYPELSAALAAATSPGPR
jgi:hypothetical protein